MIAVVTMAFGEDYERLYELTSTSQQSYARRIGADFVRLDARRYDLPHYEKFQLFDLLSRYERVIWLDCDVIVRADCPDLFSLVQDDCLGVLDESPWHQDGLTYCVDAAKELGYQVGNPTAYYNTGVMVLSRRHRSLFAPPEKVLSGHLPEQNHINARILRDGVKVHGLDWRFNCMGQHQGGSYWREASVIHHSYRPVDERMSSVRRDLMRWDNQNMKPCLHTDAVEGCRICHLYQHDARYRKLWGGDVIQCVVSADGIGDALLTLTTVAGLRADNPESRIVLTLLGTAKVGAPWQKPWVDIFDAGYDEVRLNLIKDVTTYWPSETYQVQNATRLAKPRWEHYADASKTTARLPKLRPVAWDVAMWAEQYRGAIVLAPFSVYTCRTWLLSHWLRLEKLLQDSGRQVVILDGRTPDTKRTDAFTGDVVRDAPAAKVAALLKVAGGFVGCDSGMTHLAGCVGTPSVAICGPIKGGQVFGIYPTVRVLDGPLGCGGCHWQQRHGWASHCDSICANMQLVTPESVVKALDDHDRRTLLSADRLAVLADTARRVSQLPGDLAELGVYRGGSARVIHDACPAKVLHLFDTFVGIPEDDEHGQHKAGDFNTNVEDVKQYLSGDRYRFHVGFFPDSAAGLDDVKLAFAHVDLDTYQSTKAALDWVWPRLVPGGAIVLDDWKWAKCPGVERAVRECLPDVPVEETAFIQARLWKPVQTSATKGCNCGKEGLRKTR